MKSADYFAVILLTNTTYKQTNKQDRLHNLPNFFDRSNELYVIYCHLLCDVFDMPFFEGLKNNNNSGDWLFALLIASCGLRLDDEAVRVAVGIRLGLPICVSHQCQCGELVDAYGIVCK